MLYLAAAALAFGAAIVVIVFRPETAIATFPLILLGAVAAALWLIRREPF